MTSPMQLPRAATLADVAKRAGVSLGTASKALNGREDVSARTRQRVIAIAEEMDFVPNPSAQALMANRTRTVGLLTSDLVGRFVLPVLMGAEDAFGAGQIDVFLCDARGDTAREKQHVRALLSRRVDGIIVVGSQTDPRPSLGHQLPVPVVYAYAPSDDPNDVSFTPDNTAAGNTTVHHLLHAGRCRIAHITGDPTYAAAQDRANGVQQALAAARITSVQPTMFGEWSEKWGRDATAALLDTHPEVDGIIAGSDQIARGVLDTLRDRGKQTSGEIAVASFDNWEVLATQAQPTISSIDFNLQDLGHAAARAIFDTLDGTSVAAGIHYFPTRLIVRESTASSPSVSVPPSAN